MTVWMTSGTEITVGYTRTGQGERWSVSEISSEARPVTLEKKPQVFILRDEVIDIYIVDTYQLVYL